jgi:probable rRNA maturation factor
VETALRQAEKYSWPLSSEFCLLGVHGFLHLMGYDDETEAGAFEMELLTRRILTDTAIAIPINNHPFFQRKIESG